MGRRESFPSAASVEVVQRRSMALLAAVLAFAAALVFVPSSISLVLASWFAILFGLLGAVSAGAAVAALPIAVWEFSLGVYLTIWGFKPFSNPPLDP